MLPLAGAEGGSVPTEATRPCCASERARRASPLRPNSRGVCTSAGRIQARGPAPDVSDGGDPRPVPGEAGPAEGARPRVSRFAVIAIPRSPARRTPFAAVASALRTTRYTPRTARYTLRADRYSTGSGPAGHARRGGARTIAFTLAHLSDLHVTPIRIRRLGELANKRALGWLSWRRRRRHEHRAEILDALLDDLSVSAPDHVAITGDLTNVGLPEEIDAVVPWLERMGGPGCVSVVPGNHDAYAARVQRERFAAWHPYLHGAQAPDASHELRFPYVRRVGSLALVGLSSAVPTLPGLARGELGAEQLERLGETLSALAAETVARVVLVHHPPVPAGQSRRRQLADASALRDVLARHGAELVIHGHTHRTSLEHVAGPGDPIPVVGVPSSSARGSRPGRRARYHLYRFAPRENASGFRISCAVRALDPDGLRFAAAGEHAL